MRSNLSKALRNHDTSVLELAGLLGLAVAVGFLAGIWWGVLTGSLCAVLLANTAPRRLLPPDDA